MDIEDAKELIDYYGSHTDLWPAADWASVEAAIDSSDELRAYYDEAKRIDDLLDYWEEDEDGADIEDDSADKPEEGQPEEDDSEESEQIEFDPDQIKSLEEMLEGAISDMIAQGNEDGAFNVFSRDEDKFVEIETHDGVSTEHIKERVMKATSALQNEMRRLMAAKKQVRKRPGLRKGRINASSLHRVIAGDDRVFFRREEQTDIDTAVYLLIECSASMVGIVARRSIATPTWGTGLVPTLLLGRTACALLAPGAFQFLPKSAVTFHSIGIETSLFERRAYSTARLVGVTAITKLALLS